MIYKFDYLPAGLFNRGQVCFTVITNNCSCNIQRNFSALKIENFFGKILMILIGLLKTSIVGTQVPTSIVGTQVPTIDVLEQQ